MMALILKLLSGAWKWLALYGAMIWARQDAKHDARQQTALEAAERDGRTLKEIANADHFDGSDPDLARRWLQSRKPDSE